MTRLQLANDQVTALQISNGNLRTRLDYLRAENYHQTKICGGLMILATALLGMHIQLLFPADIAWIVEACVDVWRFVVSGFFAVVLMKSYLDFLHWCAAASEHRNMD